jgi:hypothetical protein
MRLDKREGKGMVSEFDGITKFTELTELGSGAKDDMGQDRVARARLYELIEDVGVKVTLIR